MDRQDELDVSVFIVTEANVCVQDGEYVRMDDGEGVAVMVTNDLLDQEYGEDNTFCLSGTLDGRKEWCKDDCECDGMDVFHYPNRFALSDSEITEFTYQTMAEHAGGYRMTHDILSGMCRGSGGAWCGDDGEPLSMREMFPAFSAAFDSTLKVGGDTLHGFLPGIGQLTCVTFNIGTINEAFYHMTGVSHRIQLRSDNWWSATLYDSMNAWMVNNQMRPRISVRRFAWRVLPLYRLKK